MQEGVSSSGTLMVRGQGTSRAWAVPGQAPPSVWTTGSSAAQDSATTYPVVSDEPWGREKEKRNCQTHGGHSLTSPVHSQSAPSQPRCPGLSCAWPHARPCCSPGSRGTARLTRVLVAMPQVHGVQLEGSGQVRALPHPGSGRVTAQRASRDSPGPLCPPPDPAPHLLQDPFPALHTGPAFVLPPTWL